MITTETTTITIDIPNELIDRIHSLLAQTEDCDVNETIVKALDEYLIGKSISIGFQNLVNLKHKDVAVLSEIVQRGLSSAI